MPRTVFKSKSYSLSSKPIKPLKRAKIASQSNYERSKLIRSLDRVFSVYIRMKDAVYGDSICVTCGTRKPWGSQQNGHFIPRRFMSVRWDEDNCHVQCAYCNETLHGNLARYRSYLGDDLAEQLRLKSLEVVKFTIPDLEDMIKLYTAKVKALDG